MRSCSLIRIVTNVNTLCITFLLSSHQLKDTQVVPTFLLGMYPAWKILDHLVLIFGEPSLSVSILAVLIDLSGNLHIVVYLKSLIRKFNILHLCLFIERTLYLYNIAFFCKELLYAEYIYM